MKKVGFIGAGNMGGALAGAAAKTSAEIYLTDKDTAKAEALAVKIGATVSTAETIAQACDIIFLGVKPNIVSEALLPIADKISRSGATLVSMAAGVSIEKIEKCFNTPTPVIRIMPNTPASVGEGMILYSRGSSVSDGAVADFLAVMSEAGTLDLIDERLIDAGSALSGCGPAFVYMFIEALSDGAVECGLPRDKAILYAANTLRGSAKMVLETGTHPGALKDAVCSPGGSTIEGVHALEDGAFRATVIDAVTAAFEKTKQLGK